MKKLRRFFSKFSSLFDPFLVLGIFLLFAIPVITIINLTPGHQQPHSQDNVLGLTDQNTVTITANTVEAEGISVEKMIQKSNTTYTLLVQSIPHDKGTYENSLFTAINGTKEEKQVQITPSFENVPPDTKVSIVVNEVKFVILDDDGTTYPPTIYVMPNDSVHAGIMIESKTDVNFNTGFSLDLTVQ